MNDRIKSIAANVHGEMQDVAAKALREALELKGYHRVTVSRCDKGVNGAVAPSTFFMSWLTSANLKNPTACEVPYTEPFDFDATLTLMSAELPDLAATPPVASSLKTWAAAGGIDMDLEK